MSESDAPFELDPTLAGDCHLLGELNGQLLLLMDNTLVPWFIVVPRVEVTELCDLPEEAQRRLEKTVRQVSLYLRDSWQVDKLNVAAIGNVVRQLHVHVVGRNRQDYCWPGVVWGRPEKAAYTEQQVAGIRDSLDLAWGEQFVAAEQT